MEYTLEEKYDLIKKAVLKCDSKNPVEIARSVMNEDFVNMHGPEHHFLDGAAFIAAYYNAGGEINPDICLDELAKRTIKMPGAMCGYWGVCGSVAAVGAALAIIHGTGPLSTNEYYADNMKFTSSVIAKMAEIGGAAQRFPLPLHGRTVRKRALQHSHGNGQNSLRLLSPQRAVSGQQVSLSSE